MTVLELRDVHPVHGTGETAANALNGMSLTTGPAAADGRRDLTTPAAVGATRRCASSCP